jgi:hypothetical protein
MMNYKAFVLSFTTPIIHRCVTPLYFKPFFGSIVILTKAVEQY